MDDLLPWGWFIYIKNKAGGHGFSLHLNSWSADEFVPKRNSRLLPYFSEKVMRALVSPASRRFR